MFFRVRAGIARHGLRGFLRRIPGFLHWRFRYLVDDAYWDRAWGTETAHREHEYLAAAEQLAAHDAETYEPVAARWFRPMIRNVPIVSGEYTFIDLGSGKGRALFFAARYGFKRVIGVEFSEHLHGIALLNLASFSARNRTVPRIELVRADASAFDFPEGALLIYMFNPFHGAVMESVIRRIGAHAENTNAPVYILYKTPNCAPMFDAHGGFEKLVDQKTDWHWLTRAEPFMVYRAWGKKKAPQERGS